MPVEKAPCSLVSWEPWHWLCQVGASAPISVLPVGKTHSAAETIHQEQSFQFLGSAKERIRGPKCFFAAENNLEGDKKNQQPSIAFFNKRKKCGPRMGESCLSTSI